MQQCRKQGDLWQGRDPGNGQDVDRKDVTLSYIFSLFSANVKKNTTSDRRCIVIEDMAELICLKNDY